MTNKFRAEEYEINKQHIDIQVKDALTRHSLENLSSSEKFVIGQQIKVGREYSLILAQLVQMNKPQS